MLRCLRPPLLALATVTTLLSPPAWADGLADLKAALARLQGSSPVKGQFELNLQRRQGDGADAEESQAQLNITLEDGPQGLQVLFGRELLARIEAEQRAVADNPKAKTYTLNALNELQVSDLKRVIAAAPAIARTLQAARFKEEKPEAWNGKPARLLSFEMPLDKLPERQRKYVKQFDGSFEIWIAADGTPLASRVRQRVSGRAFVVVSFQSANDEERSYGVVGDRLVMLQHETRSTASGAGEKDDRKQTTRFQPRP
jgi:hypothetical protein